MQELLKQINELKRDKETMKSALEGLEAEVGEIKKMLKRDN
jgi:wobble nucleotide-excising tRNase